MKIYLRRLKDNKLILLDKPQKGCWILVDEDDLDDLETISKKLKISHNLLKDSFDILELPRLEIFQNKLYLFVRGILSNQDSLSMYPILFVVAEDYILTASRKATYFFNPFLNQRINFYTTQKTKFLLLSLLMINREYRKYINKIAKEIDFFQENIIDFTDQKIIEISRKELLLSSLLTTLSYMNKVYENILHREYLDFLQEEKNIVDDLGISVQELIEILRYNLKRVQSIKSSYVNIMNSVINTRLQYLTILTVLLFIPTIIFSLYGMNIELPLQSHKNAFYYINLINFLLVTVTIVIFKLKKWL
ncbi:MAG: putative divalent cation transport protein [Candidatus Parcubacteria bacterium]|nr:MAG: putative divalent cation transport protein [Candidatus Parcubacteria bacterium]